MSIKDGIKFGLGFSIGTTLYKTCNLVLDKVMYDTNKDYKEWRDTKYPERKETTDKKDNEDQVTMGFQYNGGES